MKLSDFVGKPCKSRAAFEFVPKKRTHLNLEEVAKKLKEAGVFIEAETPFLLVVKAGSSVSIFQSGKIIVKETTLESEARKIAEKLVKMLE